MKKKCSVLGRWPLVLRPSSPPAFKSAEAHVTHAVRAVAGSLTFWCCEIQHDRSLCRGRAHLSQSFGWLGRGWSRGRASWAAWRHGFFGGPLGLLSRSLLALLGLFDGGLSLPLPRPLGNGACARPGRLLCGTHLPPWPSFPLLLEPPRPPPPPAAIALGAPLFGASWPPAGSSSPGSTRRPDGRPSPCPGWRRRLRLLPYSLDRLPDPWRVVTSFRGLGQVVWPCPLGGSAWPLLACWRTVVPNRWKWKQFVLDEGMTYKYFKTVEKASKCYFFKARYRFFR